ncbi:MAG: hypothetical protein IJ017_03870 [Oscillospiraceae bacterium]|nr:hypothetical protein [Oscillospiraceae bacterium]
MEKYYSFAGVDLTVIIPKDNIYTHERLLEPFSAEKGSDPSVFVFEVTDKIDAPAGNCAGTAPGLRVYREGELTVKYFGSVKDTWEGAYARVESCGKNNEVQLLKARFPREVGVKTVLNCIGAEHLVPRAGGFVFHCSYVDIGGRAIIFTAPSGVGKSTQAELWKNLRGAEIINGDRAVIRCTESGVYACGIPFAGSSSYCINRDLPLAAVVYLGQAPATKIRRLHGYEAFSRIWEGCSINTWDEEDVKTVSDLVARAAQSVPVFHLMCTPDESAVAALENILAEVERK